ncbi:hypothetical protein [Microbacterium sp. GCS4]|uniref:hypothetical protein n=1 Tax=Microbacterium sp. GCS4 TaxID=1692239 RepID=UPI00068079B5|nr:hypothetical protein [Microbacterium sp. GCS4]KNY04831.1 hypothetical protein AKH00_15305 [Microbacterium sp. GCS4]
MNAQATRRGVPAVVLWGGLGALAWAAITALTGGSSAQADEQSDPSLLGGVSSLVSETVTAVGDTVTAVTQPVVTEVVAPVVTEVVAPVVTQVVAPVQQAAPAVVETVSDTVAEVPVVGPAAAPVVEAVADTAQGVVDPVTDLLQEAPVSQIVTPVQDAVAALPLVGTLIDRLGVNTLLTSVVGVLDDTTALVGGVVEGTVPPVLEALAPSRPGAVEDDVAAIAAPSSVMTATTPPASAQGTAAPTVRPASPAASPAMSAPSAGEGPTLPASGGSPAAPVSSVGSGGASVLSHARTSDVGFSPLRAVERTPGASDDVLPTSLVADTDVSPD